MTEINELIKLCRVLVCYLNSEEKNRTLQRVQNVLISILALKTRNSECAEGTSFKSHWVRSIKAIFFLLTKSQWSS